MKLILVLLGLIPILLELTSANARSHHQTSIDPYGRLYRMSEPNHQQLDEDDDVEDEDDDEDDDEQDDDAIYPPDFAKLFPNPDGRPVGPEGATGRPQSDQGYSGNHPTSPQHGRPAHGPASLRGPAALRGPIQAQHGQKQGGIGHAHQGPPSRDGPPPSYGPSRDGPPPSYGPSRDGPPPSYGPPRRGPPPQYRHDINELDEEVIPEGRNYHGAQRVVTYPARRVVAYPSYAHRRVAAYAPVAVRRNPYVTSAYPRYPGYNTHRYYPRYTPVSYGRHDIDSVENSVEAPVFAPSPRIQGARIYNPWAHNPARPDAYNPQFVYNPTEMLSRRRFRYHPSQIMPSQRLPLHSLAGTWGNPRNTYIHSQTGQQYGQRYWAPHF